MIFQIYASGDTVLVEAEDGTNGVAYLGRKDEFDWQTGVGIALLRWELEIEADDEPNLGYFGRIEVSEHDLVVCADELASTEGWELERMADCVRYDWI